MANIKSAKKRILVSERNAERNKAIKSGVKTSVKKVYAAIESGDKAATQTALTDATKTIDMSTSREYITRILLQEKFLVCQRLSTRWLKR